jgi:hypothetical protein
MHDLMSITIIIGFIPYTDRDLDENYTTVLGVAAKLSSLQAESPHTCNITVHTSVRLSRQVEATIVPL